MTTKTPAKLQTKMVEFYRQMFDPDHVVEIRGLGTRPVAGWFDFQHIPEAVVAALRLSEQRSGSDFHCHGVYWVMNPVKRDLQSRCANRLTPAGRSRGLTLTTDLDVVSRRWLLIDVDPIRTAGVSSTDAEKSESWKVAELVLDFLTENGWNKPFILDSGNGFHLLYRIDLPNDDQSTALVKNILRAIAHTFDTPLAKVDTSVFNASRICKFYGTTPHKGDSTNERPHRLSKPISSPESVKPIAVALLQYIAGLAPAERKHPTTQALQYDEPCDEEIWRYLSTIDPAVSGQNGHGKTFWAACQLVQGFDLSPGQAKPHLLRYNDQLGEQWSDSDIDHKLEDANKRSGPRGYLRKRRPVAPKHANEFDLTYFGSDEDDPLAGLGLVDSLICSGADVTQSIAKPAFKPEPIRNFEEIADDSKRGFHREGIGITVIADRVYQATGEWPRRVGGCLFVPSFKGDGVEWIQNANSLMSFLGEVTGFPPQFIEAKEDRHVHSRGELFCCLKRVATCYEAVEVLPHEPPMSGHYYACEIPAAGDGVALQRLVDFFSPETMVDRDLILAAFVTPFWGGESGARPAFIITAEGRGNGKSKLATAIACVAGGSMSVGATEEYEKVATRLLSPVGLSKRILLLDNIKSLKFSSADLEALITSQVISGKQLYEGEGQRPNNLTVLVTINGVNLSKDLAQRGVIIHLRKPDFSGTWEEELFGFIETNRQAIIGDILAFLRQPPTQLECFNRWGLWQKEVMSKLPEPAEAAAVVKEREVAADADAEESGLVEEYFFRQLEEIGYQPASEKIFIPSLIAFEWYSKAVGERFSSSTKGLAALRQKANEGEFRRIQDSPNRHKGRGFLWFGDDSIGDEVRRDVPHQIEIHKTNKFERWTNH